jgi:pectinesterase
MFPNFMLMKLLIAFLILFFAGGRSYAQQNDFTVAFDGSGDYKTVQDAINAVPDFRKNRTTIYIKSGTYKEKIVLPKSKSNITLAGQDAEKTILTYDDFASKKNHFGEEMGTTGSASFYVFAEDFVAENITFENSAGPVGQAVAVRIDADRVMFNNCRFLGWQDTLYPFGEKNRVYFKKCYIEGSVDFIFGWSTAVFEDCSIYCKKSGYITAASTAESSTYGFVFINCEIRGDAPENSFYLGRPWRPFAKTVFINCFMDKHIKQEGWNNWNKPDAEKTSYYAEYNSRGPGANTSSRVSWSHQLTSDEAAHYTFENIFGDWKIKQVPR